jgi:hypothetical protein
LNSKNRRLKLESLESRKLMAGDVAVAVEGSLMTIDGDNLDNQVVVSQALNGNVSVIGQNGTLINGLPSVTFRNPQLNAMEVRMGDGNDVVTVRGLQLTNDMFVELGEGNDRLTSPATLPVTVGANAMIEGGLGNDIVSLAGITVRENLSIDGGLGSLNTTISNATVDQALSVIGDELDDIISISRATVGDLLTAETKGGADRVTFTDVLAYSAHVNTDASGASADRVTMNRVATDSDIGIFTGAGNDVVRLTDVTSRQSLTVSTDSGNDFVSSTRVSAAFDAVYEGGAGVDTFEDFGIVAGVKKDVKEFEIFR